MDIAYDHIQEENFKEEEQKAGKTEAGAQSPTINQDFQDAYKAFASSPWGAKLGGIWGTVRKQGEQYYSTAQQEYTAASATASKGFSDLLTRTRGISLSQAEDTGKDPDAKDTARDVSAEAEQNTTLEAEAHPERPESLPADIYKEASTVGFSLAARLKAEAQKRLKDAQKLEDAADEALLKWGTNIGAFLKEAVSIAPPSSEDLEKGTGEVLFASTDKEGKRVVHATRLDAQLHVIHCSLDSFLHDPKSGEWEAWQKGFDVEKRTDEIASDLDKYSQLRSAMERLVPEKVEYATFWCRYYFLRHVVETEEVRRKELLKGAVATTTEDVSWDDESEDEATTPNASKTALPSAPSSSAATVEKRKAATTTAKDDSDNATLKPTESRKSNDGQSVSGSDASYDIVSGATSKTPSSPREAKKDAESDDDDWE